MNTDPFLASLIATLAVGAVAFFAVFLLTSAQSRLRSLTRYLITLAAGVLIGDVFLHLLPELVEEQGGYTTETAIFILAGILVSLTIESLIHCYNHDHYTEGTHEHHNPAAAYLSLISDALHNFLDGISIAASFILNPVTGVITTIGIFLHEIPQELADVAILLHSGWERKKVLLGNVLTALTAVLGMIVFFLVSEISPALTTTLVGFAIGQLTYVALADLLPEIHKHKTTKSYVISVALFVVGLVVMGLLLGLEA
ncbi:MAG: ZIP family metal transporter [Candidatus Doudnabacteria bacterium]|nr:ZIP family metal transporter [Candidatus Doudnabacteria bacterium]